MFGPMEFLNIWATPHKVPDVVSWKLQSFMAMEIHVWFIFKFVGDNGIFYEDDMMNYLSFVFKENANLWYESLGKGTIPSIVAFLEAFCTFWCLYANEQWLTKV